MRRASGAKTRSERAVGAVGAKVDDPDTQRDERRSERAELNACDVSKFV